ncbi:MAG: adenosine deaminase [Spirochaetes bacterium GWF1_51_8]|nr:MAG: adenosine deaminase [Spirochaetes bacterium GWF1_51_8]
MAQFDDRFLKAIPKTDVHVHLDGSMRVPTLIELARDMNVKLPSKTEEGLNELVFKESYANLDEYLKGFGYTCAILQDLEAIERVSYELAIDNFAEGVRYIEVRFAPQLLMDDARGFELVVGAADKGFKRARTEINSKIPADEPEFDYGMIICAMRFFNEHFSPYYKRLVQVHAHSAPREQIKMASLEAARATVRLRQSTDFQVVGFDIAGSEYGYPADNHRESYEIIHKHFIKKTVHAGEAYGPESIFQAITKLHADRIGHGLFLFDENMIFSKDIKDKKRYIQSLANYVAERRITIEVCLTSNLQTTPSLKALKDHSFGKMLDNSLSVTLCTDNRLVSHTTVTNEVKLAIENFDITPKRLKNIIIYGFKRSFNYQPYPKKREYVRRVINYYEKLEREYGIE